MAKDFLGNEVAVGDRVVIQPAKFKGFQRACVKEISKTGRSMTVITNAGQEGVRINSYNVIKVIHE